MQLVIAVRHGGVAAGGVSGIGCFHPVQHAGVGIGAGFQLGLGGIPRVIKEHIVLRGLARGGAIALDGVIIAPVGVVRCIGVLGIGVDALHRQRLGLGGAVIGGAQKRQACNGQPGVILGFPVHSGAVKGIGIRGLPGGAVITAADKSPQVYGFFGFVAGGQGQIRHSADLDTPALAQGAIRHTTGSGFYLNVQPAAADPRQPGNGGAQRGGFHPLGRGLQPAKGNPQRRAQQPPTGQRQRKAKPARRQRGRLLDVIMAAKVLAVVFGIAPAPQGPPLHRAGSRPRPHPTGQKQQAGGHSRRGPGQRQQHNNGQQH